MSVFKRRHFAGEVIFWAVHWYCRYGISYRELEEMLAERGVEVDHTTLDRWVPRHAPELDKRLAGDHGKLKRLIRPTLGFQSMRTARATIKGFEVMRMFKKGQFRLSVEAVGTGSEIAFINRVFGLAT